MSSSDRPVPDLAERLNAEATATPRNAAPRPPALPVGPEPTGIWDQVARPDTAPAVTLSDLVIAEQTAQRFTDAERDRLRGWQQARLTPSGEKAFHHRQDLLFTYAAQQRPQNDVHPTVRSFVNTWGYAVVLRSGEVATELQYSETQRVVLVQTRSDVGAPVLWEAGTYGQRRRVEPGQKRFTLTPPETRHLTAPGSLDRLSRTRLQPLLTRTWSPWTYVTPARRAYLLSDVHWKTEGLPASLRFTAQALHTGGVLAYASVLSTLTLVFLGSLAMTPLSPGSRLAHGHQVLQAAAQASVTLGPVHVPVYALLLAVLYALTLTTLITGVVRATLNGSGQLQRYRFRDAMREQEDLVASLLTLEGEGRLALPDDRPSLEQEDGDFGEPHELNRTF